MTPIKNFAEYEISEMNGFLPDVLLKELPGEFSEWDRIVKNLPKLIESKMIRQEVEKLPQLNVEKLVTLPEKRRAYSILCMIEQAYLFGGGGNLPHNPLSGESVPPQELPSQVAVPLHTVAENLGLPTALTHATVDLYNWELIDKNQPISLDNLKSIETFTGTIDEQWFYLVMVAIEAEGAPIIQYSQLLIELMMENDREGVTSCLDAIRKRLGNMAEIVRRTREKCDPKFFYHVLRKFLSGYNDKKTFQYGLKMSGVIDKRTKDSDVGTIGPMYVNYAGGSAAQSSLIQLIDRMFAVKHEKDSVKNFLKDMHNYMPRQHRKFLEYVENQYEHYSLKDYCMDQNLSEVYNQCLSELENFRKAHFGLVHTYILPFIEQMAHGEAKGTGGTELKKFLSATIDDTKSTQIRQGEQKKMYRCSPKTLGMLAMCTFIGYIGWRWGTPPY